jgi:hypothetical protein
VTLVILTGVFIVFDNLIEIIARFLFPVLSQVLHTVFLYLQSELEMYNMDNLFYQEHRLNYAFSHVY